ncbi:MAG: hypothetical protein R3Y32_09210 [Bacillota bacterium]
MKKIVFGSGGGGYRTVLSMVCVANFCFCALLLYAVFTQLITGNLFIEKNYELILCLVTFAFIELKLCINNYFAMFDFTFTKKNVYLPISHYVVAKLCWDNVEKIYMDEKSCNLLHVDLKYSIKQLPRAKKLLKEGKIEKIDDTMCRGSIQLLLINGADSDKSDFDAIMALWNQYNANKLRTKKKIRHITYDTGSLNWRNVILYALLVIAGKIFSLMM